MKTIQKSCLCICLIILFYAVDSGWAGERQLREEKTILIGKIISVSHNHKTAEKEIRIKGQEIPISPNVKIFKKHNVSCKIGDLPLPFMARVLLALDKDGKEQIIRIEPGEE